MKTVINVCIGGMSFTIDEDAYQKLDSYLDEFKSKSGIEYQAKEVMEDVELRIADIFKESLSTSHQEVVNATMVEDVIRRIGLPDGSSASDKNFDTGSDYRRNAAKKFYRDSDDKKIAGVCSGLAAYFDVDVVLIRVIFVIALICGSAGFWIYLVFWIIAPLAVTAAQKCEMRGIPATADNMRQFSGK